MVYDPSSMYGTSTAGTPTAQYGVFSDWASMIQGVSTGGGISGGPLGGAGASAGTAAGVGGAGIALGIWALSAENRITGQEAVDSAAILSLEGKQRELQRAQMNRQTQRQELENFRNMQKAIATGRAAAVNQGANTAGSSGIAGGRAGDVAQGATNTSALAQNQFLGNQGFDIANSIDYYKSLIAGEQGKAATMQGWFSLAEGAVAGAGNIGKLAAS